MFYKSNGNITTKKNKYICTYIFLRITSQKKDGKRIQILDIMNLGLTEWPKQLICKDYLIKELNCSNKLTSLTVLLTLKCS